MKFLCISTAAISRGMSRFRDSSAAEWIARYPTQQQQQEEVGQELQPLQRQAHRPNEVEEIKRKRLLWQSRKRGILECDLLLGTFVEKFGANLTSPALEQYDRLLDENDWDIYYWCTGAKPVPNHIKNFEFWEDLVEHSKNPERKILRMPDV